MPDDGAVRQLGAQALQLVDVELVGVVGGGEGVGGDEEPGAAQRLGGVAVGRLGEPDEQPPGVRRAPTRRSARRPGAPGRRAISTAPGANRSSGESVCTSTTSSPRRPCARTTMPDQEQRSLPVGVDDIHPHAPAADAADDRAQRGGRATTAADHLAEVLGVHPDLEGAAAAGGDQLDLHVVRVVDDAPDEVLQRVRQDASRCLR